VHRATLICNYKCLLSDLLTVCRISDRISYLSKIKFVGESLYCSHFWGRKINLFGISPAKHSQSGPNSVYVDRSRGDNIQGILGAIGPVWAKWGLGRVPQSPSFLCGNPEDFRQLRNGRFSPNLVTKRRGFRKDIFENFHFRGHFPQNLKSKIGQAGTSLRAGYRSRDALQRDTVYSTL